VEILYLLIPLSLALVALIAWALLWAVRSGQFDDLEGPAWRVLMDDDRPAERDGEGDHGPAERPRDRERDREDGAP